MYSRHKNNCASCCPKWFEADGNRKHFVSGKTSESVSFLSRFSSTNDETIKSKHSCLFIRILAFSYGGGGGGGGGGGETWE